MLGLTGKVRDSLFSKMVPGKLLADDSGTKKRVYNGSLFGLSLIFYYAKTEGLESPIPCFFFISHCLDPPPLPLLNLIVLSPKDLCLGPRKQFILLGLLSGTLMESKTL